MGNDEDCVIEISDACVIVALDGVRAEVRGEQARNVKRQVARHLLSAIARVPDMVEMEQQRAQVEARYGQQEVARADRYAGESNARAAIGGANPFNRGLY